MKRSGIDISIWQQYPDYDKLKKDPNVDFVIAQIGYGRYSYQKDETFEYNYKNARSRGVPIGGYWFSYANSPDDAREEARACLEIINGRQFEYPIYYDIEGNALAGDVSGKCKAFCSELEKAGWFAGIYISRSPAMSYLDDECRTKYAMWIADYANQCYYNGDYGIWQYKSTGRVSGISGDVDMNYCYVDYPALISEGGFNGYPKSHPDQPETLDYSGYAEGDKGLGVLAYKQMLRFLREKGALTQKLDNNGSFGPGTTKATNEFLGLIGKNPNGIAGANTIKALGERIKEV